MGKLKLIRLNLRQIQRLLGCLDSLKHCLASWIADNLNTSLAELVGKTAQLFLIVKDLARIGKLGRRMHPGRSNNPTNLAGHIRS